MHRIFVDSEFTQFGLVPDSGCQDDKGAGVRVADWLAAFPGRKVVSYDYKLDWFYLESILRAARRWEYLTETLSRDDIAGVAPPGSPGEAAQNSVFESSGPLRRHHALVDARALRAAWQAHTAAAQPVHLNLLTTEPLPGAFVKLLSDAPGYQPPDAGWSPNRAASAEVPPAC